MERSRAALAAVTGQESFLVRTPFGVRTKTVLENIESPLILWSQDPAAGKTVSGEKMAKKVISTIQDGDIILLHDSTQANLDAACRIIDTLRPRGYDFVTVDELFRLRGITPEQGAICKRAAPAADPQAYEESRLREHWAWPFIADVENRGVMNGDAEGFHPNRYLSRAAAAEILWRAAGSPQGRPRRGFPGCCRGRLVRACRFLGGGKRRRPGHPPGAVPPLRGRDTGAAVCDDGSAAGAAGPFCAGGRAAGL